MKLDNGAQYNCSEKTAVCRCSCGQQMEASRRCNNVRSRCNNVGLADCDITRRVIAPLQRTSLGCGRVLLQKGGHFHIYVKSCGGLVV